MKITERLFNNIPRECLEVLINAKKYKAEGWASDNYKASYLAFIGTLQGETISENKFDALVEFYTNTDRNKTTGAAHWNRKYRFVPNKMMPNRGMITK